MRKKLFFAGLIVLLSACIMDYYNHQLSITNNSGKELSVLYSNDVEIPANENNVDFYIADWETVKPDSTFTIVMPGNENVWHEYIADGSTKKLYFYIFETDTLKKYKNNYSMRGFVQMNKYFKSFSYTENELKKINWNIVVGK